MKIDSTPNMKPSQPNIFDYVDYRVFVKDMIEFAKREDSDFSFRKFAKKCGLASAGHIYLIISGKTGVSEKTAQKLAKGFDLSKVQAKAFIDLAVLAQTESEEEREHLKSRMLNERAQQQRTHLQAEQLAYYSHWYYPAIREMVALADFKFDTKWIAEKLLGKVTPQQVAQALKDLFALGLIRSSGAEVVQTQASLTTGDRAPNAELISSFHSAMMDQAKLAQAHVESEMREISSLTITLEHSQLQALKEEIIQFRKGLFRKYGEAKPSHDSVYQINLQLFPLTKSGK